MVDKKQKQEFDRKYGEYRKQKKLMFNKNQIEQKIAMHTRHSKIDLLK